jgi:rhamnose utilization protein RhaD (predicted bifunctional aldolase and dehydrogenase)
VSNELVSDSAVEKALDYLRDNADAIGEAVREAKMRESMVKVVLAFMMKGYPELSAAAQEREARASPDYLEAVKAEAKAAGELAKMRALREAASMKIEVWRSASANYRSMKIG